MLAWTSDRCIRLMAGAHAPVVKRMAIRGADGADLAKARCVPNGFVRFKLLLGNV